jgi:fibrillarin-like pre-rRNA processing protein
MKVTDSISAQEIVPGVFILDVDGQTRLATRSTDPAPVYGERIMGGYRLWDPFRSKLAALLLKSKGRGLRLKRDAKVLYLGAATGTTVSHVSDIVVDGLVYAVEFSPRSMRDLIRLCERRKNIIPILADAARPEAYAALVEPVDLVYQDIAQRNQAEIASLNCARYLRSEGELLLMLKTRSVDTTASPETVLQSEKKNLLGLDLIDVIDLLPFHQDHWAMQARKP